MAIEMTCQQCHAMVRTDDRFCPQCGYCLDDGNPDSLSSTLATATSGQRQGRRWYRRKLVLIPLTMLLLMAVAVGAAIVYVNERFETINSLSTPPSEVTGDRLGGDSDLVIDTGPAQEALRRAQEGDPTPAATLAGAIPGASNFAMPGAMLLSFQQGEAAPATPIATPVASPVATPAALPGDATPPALHLPPAETGKTINVLLMGVDARPGEAIDIGVRTDTLVVLNLDPVTGSCRLLSIPRDSWVELPGYGNSKVNHALAVAGVPYQMLVVENLLGIPLDHYGLIDFNGVKELVDAMGGITVMNDGSFTFEGHDFPEGPLELNGEEALSFVRFRGDAEGDFGRQERQQLVVRGLLAAGADLDVVTAIPELFDAVEDHVRTDASLTTLVDLGRTYHSTCTADSLDAKRINGEVTWLYDVLLDQPLSFVVLDPDDVEEKVEWLLTGEEPPTPTPAATPVASPVAATPVATPPPGTPAATPARGNRSRRGQARRMQAYRRRPCPRHAMPHARSG